MQLTHPPSLPELTSLTVEAFRTPFPKRLIDKGNASIFYEFPSSDNSFDLIAVLIIASFVWWGHVLVLHFCPSFH
jgi:hypothetical protein